MTTTDAAAAAVAHDDEFKDPDRVRVVPAAVAAEHEHAGPEQGDDGRDFDGIFR